MAFRFTSDIFLRTTDICDITFRILFQVVIPTRIMLASQTGGDEGNYFTIKHCHERHRALLICRCADGCQLNNIPSKNFRDSVFPLCQLQDCFIHVMSPGSKKPRHWTQHKDLMQQFLESIGPGSHLSNQIVTGPSLWISTAIWAPN